MEDLVNNNFKSETVKEKIVNTLKYYKEGGQNIMVTYEDLFYGTSNAIPKLPRNTSVYFTNEDLDEVIDELPPLLTDDGLIDACPRISLITIEPTLVSVPIEGGEDDAQQD